MSGSRPTSLECSGYTFDGEGVIIDGKSNLVKTPSPKKFSVKFNSAVTEVRPRDEPTKDSEEKLSQRELDLLEVLERDEVLVRCLEDNGPGSRSSIHRMRSPEPPPHLDDDNDDDNDNDDDDKSQPTTMEGVGPNT